MGSPVVFLGAGSTVAFVALVVRAAAVFFAAVLVEDRFFVVLRAEGFLAAPFFAAPFDAALLELRRDRARALAAPATFLGGVPCPGRWARAFGAPGVAFLSLESSFVSAIRAPLYQKAGE